MGRPVRFWEAGMLLLSICNQTQGAGMSGAPAQPQPLSAAPRTTPCCSRSTSPSSCSCGPRPPSRLSHAAARCSGAAGTAALLLRRVAAPATAAAAAPPAAAARPRVDRHSAASGGGPPPRAAARPPVRRVPLPPPPGRRRRSPPRGTATPAAHCCGPVASEIHAGSSWPRCSQGWGRERAQQGERHPWQPQAPKGGTGVLCSGVNERRGSLGQAHRAVWQRLTQTGGSAACCGRGPHCTPEAPITATSFRSYRNCMNRTAPGPRIERAAARPLTGRAASAGRLTDHPKWCLDESGAA